MRMLVLVLRNYPFLLHFFIRIHCGIHEKMHIVEIQCVPFVVFLHVVFVTVIEIGFSALVRFRFYTF